MHSLMEMLKVFVLPAIAIALASCSVKYEEGGRNADKEMPEFVFLDAKVQRVEKGDVKAALKTSALEQYKDGAHSYAKDVKFATMKGKEISAEGQCQLLLADTDKEEYLLFGGISLSNKERGIDITAASLKWDGKSKQLTSGMNDTMSIRKGGTVVYGSAFSSNSTSGEFAFGGAVSGEAETEE